jgi:signal transduction histidine kinase
MLAIVYGEGRPETTKIYRNNAFYAEHTPASPRPIHGKGLAHLVLGLPHHSYLGQAGTATGDGAAVAGVIDEVRVYDHPLSAIEIEGVFTAGAVPVPRVFWRTVSFQVPAILTTLGLVLLSVRTFETRQYRRQLQHLEHQTALHGERARIAKDMHDGLGANLTRIKLLSELVEREAAAPDKAIRYARRISRIAREVAQGMDEIVWAVNPEKDRLENFVGYLGSFIDELLGVTHLRYRLDFPDVLPELPLPAEFRHHLFLAAKEALHNTVKHSQATEVWIRLKFIDGQLEIRVQDDGQGFAPEAVSPSRNGLVNMTRRLTQLGGSCLVQSRLGEGTEVRLTVPLTAATNSHV